MNKRKVLWLIGSILLLFLFAIFCVILKKTKVDSIRDTNQIDSYQSVSEYDYTNDRLIQHGTLLLKDLDYSFFDELDIPGMPETKEADLLSKKIYSASQCPQGLCFAGDFILLTSYSEEAEQLGALMVFDRESGNYLVTLGMDPKSHLGGIIFDGKNVWVCNSGIDAIERISYDFIELMAVSNRGDVVDASDMVDIYPVDNTPSCITFYGERLWIATHTIFMDSEMVAYHYNSTTNELAVLNRYSIPNKVQGVAFDDDGRVYLSTSYGRKASSYLKIYSSIYAMAGSKKNPQIQVELPPESEEIVIANNTLYMLFESAGEKYYNGTDGKGKSLSPIDKILTIPIEELIIN